jgi:hypothetical protein
VPQSSPKIPIDAQAIYIFHKYNALFIDFPEFNPRGFGNGKIMLVILQRTQDT